MVDRPGWHCRARSIYDTRRGASRAPRRSSFLMYPKRRVFLLVMGFVAAQGWLFTWHLLPAVAQSGATSPASTQPAERSFRIPGTLAPYQAVEIHAKVSGYVGGLKVDIGTRVRKG